MYNVFSHALHLHACSTPDLSELETWPKGGEEGFEVRGLSSFPV